MPFRPCPSGCGRFLSADDGHDHCLQCLGFQHAEDAFVDDSCVCCGRMSMISLRSRLSFMKRLAPSAATRADLSGSSRGSPADALGDLRVTVRASPPGTPPRTSYSSRSEHPVQFPGDFAGLSHGAPSISFGAPSVDRMSIAASGDGLTSSEDEGAVGLPPSGVVATAEPDPDRTAQSLAAGRLVSRSGARLWASQPCSTPLPFFPEVHEELTKSWMAPFTARSPSSASSILTTLDGGVARGYADIPQVERAIAVHLCPRNAATWRNRPRLPSKACKLTAALAAKAYSAAGQAASALHAMAILQVHQAKALKQMHEGSTDPGLMQELRTATDFALRATKVTARSLGKAMSTMVVQERHLWLNLVEMKDVDKARFLDAPISQAGLFGDTVEDFAQQFSAVQQQTEAIQHTCPGVMHHPPLPPGPGLSLPVAVGALLHPPELLRPRPNRYLGRHIEPLAGERRPPRPSQAPSRPGSRRSGPDAGNPEMLEFALSQEMARTAPLLPLGEGREENLPFLFRRWSKGQRYTLSQERAISSGFSGPWDDSVRRPASSLSPTTHFASSQESTVQGRHSSPRTSGQSRLGPREFGEDASERTAFGGSPERPCLARGDCCPPGKGRNRAGSSSREDSPYSPYFIVPKKRALTTAHIPRRVATPSRDDLADLESIRGSSGRPVCMRFPQWAYSHRHCASSGRTRSRSCWLRPTGPPGPGFPN